MSKSKSLKGSVAVLAKKRSDDFYDRIAQRALDQSNHSRLIAFGTIHQGKIDHLVVLGDPLAPVDFR